MKDQLVKKEKCGVEVTTSMCVGFEKQNLIRLADFSVSEENM